MVGGSSKMPLVLSYIKYLFRKAPVVTHNCDETVAYGVGLFSGIKARTPGIKNYILSDVCPFSLCTGTHNESNPSRPYSTVMIPRNSVLPCSVEKTFYPTHDNQKLIKSTILQGEKPYEDQNRKLGEIEVKLPKKATKKLQIKERFTYDINGILIVECFIPQTGEYRKTVISEKLSEEEIEKAIKELEKYKVDHREEKDNKQLLQRLEYLVENNIDEQRDYYFNLLDYFNRVLESQNRYRIEKTRMKISNLIGDAGFDNSEAVVEDFLEQMGSEEERPDEWEIFDKWIN